MARKFQFRLATVERLRRESRDVQRRVVAEHARGVSQLEAELAVVADEMVNNESQLRAALVQRAGEMRLDVDALRRQQTHRVYLRGDLASRVDALAQRRRTLQAERNRLAEATKHLKVIEKLRARRWQNHLAELRREEQALTDEAALNLSRYGLRRGRTQDDGP